MNILRSHHLSCLSGFVGLLLALHGQSASAQPVQADSDTLDPVTASPWVELRSSVAEPIPIPGTVKTTADDLGSELLVQSTTPGAEPPAEAAPATQTITPGRATRSGPSYVGVGANIGFGGSSDLGRGSFAVFSKIGLTRYLSARPALIASREPAILLPVTFDFPIGSALDERVRIAPYVGGGAVISTGGGSVVRGLVTGGVDIPISSRFTATASVNVGFFRNTEVGVILGVGYNF
ncbi:MAG: hypothetical protein NW224_13540 [Leptolyngbyaceae cyanobacterium bins.302]|nr:hypothetical protein [Leptolyngbyaceae cyanobacterium bins.302]